MNELAFKQDGTSYLVKGDGTFTGTSGATNTSGTWSSASADKKNQLTLKTAGKPDVTVPVNYDFVITADPALRNVLRITVPGNGAAGAPFAHFGGTIKVGTSQDVRYLTVADKEFVINGTLSFDATYKRLEITFADKRVTGIAGSARLTSVASDLLKERDLLQFTAVTTWKEGAATVKKTADIKFRGSLNLGKQGLQFIGSFEGKKTYNLLLTGTYKMGSAGLEIFSKDGALNASLKTQGSFKYNGGAGNWQVALGYSEGQGLKMEAAVDFEHKVTGTNGETTLKGKASVSSSAGKFEAKLELAGKIAIGKDRSITFNFEGALVGGEPSFALKGSATVKGGVLTFDLKHAGNTSSIQLGYSSARLNIAIEFLRGPNGPSGSFRVTWIFNLEGEQVASAPEKIEGGSPLAGTLGGGVAGLPVTPAMTRTAREPDSTPYVLRLAGIARGQYDAFHQYSESDKPLAKQIEAYWDQLKFDFPGVSTPWSAVFISWCVQTAGATVAEFKPSTAHSRFVFRAIKNHKEGTGVFHGRRLNEYKPKVGDILQNNRSDQSLTFDFAAAHEAYESHSAIVVEKGDGFIRTIGGNEADTVGLKFVELTKDGFVLQRKKDPFICLIENLKV